MTITYQQLVEEVATETKSKTIMKIFRETAAELGSNITDNQYFYNNKNKKTRQIVIRYSTFWSSLLPNEELSRSQKSQKFWNAVEPKIMKAFPDAVVDRISNAVRVPL